MLKKYSIYSLEVERSLLAGILRYPKVISDISEWVNENDFCNTLHGTLWSIINQTLKNNDKLDTTLISEKINNLNLQFENNISVKDYLDNLSLIQISEKSVEDFGKELVKIRFRRDTHDAAINLAKTMKSSGNLSYIELLETADKMLNEKISIWEGDEDKPVGLYDNIDEELYAIEQEYKQSGYDGPFPTVNRLYGSLVKSGGIVCVGARTGVGKTSLGNFYLHDIAIKNGNVKILHLDAGEMTKRELLVRSVVMLSNNKYSYNFIESGEWRLFKESLDDIKNNLYPIAAKLNIDFYNIAGKSSEEIISFIRRYYLSQVGRGNPMIAHMDYLKRKTEPNMADWASMGNFIQGVKTLITKEVPIPFWTSLQLNRAGVVNNKKVDEIDDTENTFGISDEIVQQTSYSFIMRNKHVEEIGNEGPGFGNIKLIPVKTRHLGKEWKRAINMVKTNDGKYKKNHVNLFSESFYFEDRGDMIDMVKKTSLNFLPKKKTQESGDLF